MTNELQVELRKAGYQGDFELVAIIEACGDKFSALTKEIDGDNKWWRAYQTEESYDGDCVVDCCGYEAGYTPEEAVANLWLALNKK